MTRADLEELKQRPANSCERVVTRLGVGHLRKLGGELMGPCPICSDDLDSRTATRWQTKAGGWVCAVCEDGGDVIKLVELAKKISFEDAVIWLGGTPSSGEEPAPKPKKSKDDKSEYYRERQRVALYDIWRQALAPAGTVVEAYLKGRGISLPVWPDGIARLRYAPAMVYFHGQTEDEFGRRSPRVIHRGPAMLAAIVREGRFCGLHTTYLDADAKKLAIADPDTGAALPPKKVRGSKSGGHIELVGQNPEKNVAQIIMGEGIETTLSVWEAMVICEFDLRLTQFWSAVDLGNLGGKALGKIRHPTQTNAAGRAVSVPGPEPDLSEPGIIVPDSVIDVVLLKDGDSDAVLTACALQRATTRYAKPGRSIRTAACRAGMDFNDVLRLGIKV